MNLPSSVSNLKTLNKFAGIYLYGFGHTGKRVYDLLLNSNYPVLGIADSHISISSKDFLSFDDFVGKITPYDCVLICTYNQTYASQIYKLLLHSVDCSNVFWNALDFPYEGSELIPSLSRIEELIKENYSLKLLNALSECFFSRSNKPLCAFKAMNTVDSKGQYLDVFDASGIRSMLDIGVYDGSEIINYLRSFDNLRHYYGVDPLGTKKLLPEVFSCFEDCSVDFKFYPVAIGADNSKVSFQVSGPGSSVINRQSNGKSIKLSETVNSSFEVDSLTLDRFIAPLKHDCIDLLKIDIEGGEISAIKGGTSSLRHNFRSIAISIYHSATDFVSIPLLLSRLGYSNMRIRSYTPSPIDTILYADNLTLIEKAAQ
jgi:FkbM family methyltransferase